MATSILQLTFGVLLFILLLDFDYEYFFHFNPNHSKVRGKNYFLTQLSYKNSLFAFIPFHGLKYTKHIYLLM